MTALFIAALELTTFAGGKPGELAKTLSEATGANVIIEAPALAVYSKFDFEASSITETARAVQKATGLRRAGGADSAFYVPELPLWHFAQSAVAQCLPQEPRQLRGGAGIYPTIRNGRVTLQLEAGTGLAVSSLGAGALSKKVQVDPFFDKLMLSVWVKDMAERDFLELAARAVGGKVVSDKDGLALEPLGVEVQRRALAVFDAALKSKGLRSLADHDKAELTIARAAVAEADPSKLADAVRGMGEAKGPVGPGVRQAIVPYLRASAERAVQTAQAFGTASAQGAYEPARDAFAEKYRHVDRRLIGSVIISKGFMVQLELATVDAYGRPGPRIRVP